MNRVLDALGAVLAAVLIVAVETIGRATDHHRTHWARTTHDEGDDE